MKLGSCIHLEELSSTLCSVLRLDLLFTVHDVTLFLIILSDTLFCIILISTLQLQIDDMVDDTVFLSILSDSLFRIIIDQCSATEDQQCGN